jgi:hypothetical protein
MLALATITTVLQLIPAIFEIIKAVVTIFRIVSRVV